MHDVLDPRDLVPDEAQQLGLSGYPVGSLGLEAREAAAAGDLNRLADVGQRLARLEREEDWPFDEPEDDGWLLELSAAVSPLTVDPQQLPDRVRGAWLGRTVGNTLGKPVEGLSRRQLECYLRAAGQ